MHALHFVISIIIIIFCRVQLDNLAQDMHYILCRAQLDSLARYMQNILWSKQQLIYPNSLSLFFLIERFKN